MTIPMGNLSRTGARIGVRRESKSGSHFAMLRTGGCFVKQPPCFLSSRTPAAFRTDAHSGASIRPNSAISQRTIASMHRNLIIRPYPQLTVFLSQFSVAQFRGETSGRPTVFKLCTSHPSSIVFERKGTVHRSRPSQLHFVLLIGQKDGLPEYVGGWMEKLFGTKLAS